MLCFAKSSTTVKQLATTQQIRLLLFSHKKLWSPADRRMVSSRQENGLPDFGYKLHSYPQAIFPHMSYYSTTVLTSETAHYSWQTEYA
ncbi:hypothetical protein QL285_043292 [Trifolium repens]|nr:hypothetical protein QL285_043292 [Trifolium repens]